MKGIGLAIFLFLSLVFNLKAQQYHFTHYGLNEGLAQSQVYCLLEDDKGYIWMGTYGGGLSRFDGIDFSTLTTKDGLPSNYVISLHQDKRGILWIGTSKGICQYDGERLTDLKLWPSNLRVNVISNTEKHGLLAGTTKGVFSINDSSTIPFKPEEYKNQGSTSFIESDSEGNTWIGSDAGLYWTNESSHERTTNRNGLETNLALCFAEDSLYGIWLGTYGEGLKYYNGENFETLKGLPELEKAIINDLFIDSKGVLWIATLNQGVCRYNIKESTYLFLNEEDGLSNNHADCIIKDGWGNYWIGTSGGGSNKYSGQQFEYYNKQSGLNGAYIYTVIQTATEDLWMGTSDGGITLFDGNGFNEFKGGSGFSDVKVKTLLEDSDSLLWIGTEGQGLTVFDGDTFYTYQSGLGLKSNWIKSLIEDKSKNIWIATAGGGISKLHKLDSARISFKTLRKADGLLSDRVIDLHVDTLNRVWYASRNGGVGCIINDTTIINFAQDDNLNSSVCRSLSEDSLGNLWVGTNQGINRIKLYDAELMVDSISFDKELSSVNVYLLTHDVNGQMWVGTEKGLDRLLLDEDGAIIENRHFGKDDGFSGVETNLNSAFALKNGDVWFGTVNGLHKYLSEVKLDNEIAPILNFSSITLNYQNLYETEHKADFDKENQLSLDYYENNLTVDFRGITQTFPKKVKYKWRLKGLDKNWSPVSSRNTLSYFNLGAGEYSLEILSVNENGVWNEKPLRLDFSIAKPWWKEKWFTLSYYGFGLLILILFVSARIRSIRKREGLKQRQLQQERDRINLEQKALRLQMNPHFIFHTLNSIQALIASKEESVAREYLTKFSKLMRQILENSRVNEIKLDDEIETIRNYLIIERFCNDDKFDFEIKIEDDLEVDFIKIPSMIIQPFLENAIIHGFGNAEHKGKLSVSFEDKQSFLHCTIVDNGVGREKAAKIKSTSNRNHKSTAMEVTKERLKLLTQNENAVEIIDLKNENEKAQGTKVVLRIPIID